MPPLAAIFHRLDPFAIGPFGSFGIRWYGISYVLGFLAGYFLFRALSRRKLSPLPLERAGDLVAAIAVGTVVGGRLGYCVLYQPELLSDFSGSFPFWGALAIHQGGMASHGGMLGMVCACVWFARRHHLPALHVMDLNALGAPIGIFFGRVANFINGELIGRPCSPELPWAVKFPQEMLEWLRSTNEFHSQLNSAPVLKVAELALGAPPNGLLGPAEVSRLIEASRSSDVVAAALEPLLLPRHPSQLYEALLEGVLLFAVLFLLWRRPRKPGLITAGFLIAYSIVRIAGEQFRLPDAHIGYQWLGLTRGQWLSFIPLALGLLAMRAWTRRKVEAIGGWSQGVS